MLPILPLGGNCLKNPPSPLFQTLVSPEKALENGEIQWDRATGTDRPAFDDPCIAVRPEGRQLVIHRGGTPDSDDDPHPLDGSGNEHSPDRNTHEHTGGIRGEITGFSDASRRRLRRKIHGMKRTDHAVFVSLTYHEGRPTPKEAKEDLDRFWKRISRKLQGVSAIWKMEPQERGVPHFHLFIYGTDYIDAQWVSKEWHECTDETSEDHRRMGVDVEWVRDDGKVQSYLAKYFSKTFEGWPDDGEEWEKPGRFWGTLSRKNLPYARWAKWRKYLHHDDATYLIAQLLEEWDVNTGGVIPPSLTINTRGDPEERLHSLLDRL